MIHRHLIGVVPPDDGPRLPPRRAWAEDPSWRELVCAELARSVSKTGSFDFAGGLAWLGGPDGLTGDQAAELFAAIEERAKRCPVEWQPDFEAAFPECQGKIPPLDPGLVIWAHEMCIAQAIFWCPTVAAIRPAIDELKNLGISWDQLSRWDARSIEHRYPCNADPHVSTEALTIRQLAERAGAVEIAAYLQSLGIP